MDRRIIRRRSDQRGFTLLELLVVLAILGLLTALAAPPLMNRLAGAKVSTAEIQIRNLSAALDIYRLDVGRYPSTQEGLEALVKAPPGVTRWSGPYIRDTASLTDPWGRPYTYRSPGEKGEFDLATQGPSP